MVQKVWAVTDAEGAVIKVCLNDVQANIDRVVLENASTEPGGEQKTYFVVEMAFMKMEDLKKLVVEGFLDPFMSAETLPMKRDFLKELDLILE